MEIGFNNTTYLTFLFCLYLVFLGVTALVVSKIYKKSLKESSMDLLKKGLILTIRAEREKKA